MFSFPAWNYPGLPGKSKQEKSASSWTRSTDLLNTKQMSYLYITNSDEQITIFFVAKNNILIYNNYIAD
jgi:hypothetical protein